MRLTQFSDYSLRTVLFLGAHRDRRVSIAEIARSYGISYHHLTKVASLLVELGVVESVRGRGGGLRLARDPAEIGIGWLIRRTEPDFHLVECFDREADRCPITGACGLRRLLEEAGQSFLATLDRHTLADFLGGSASRQTLVQLWTRAAAGAGAEAAAPVISAPPAA